MPVCWIHIILWKSLTSLSLTSRLKFQGLMRLDQTTWIISLFWSHLVRDLPYICKNPFPLALRLVLDRKTRRRLVYTRGLEFWGPYQNSACDENGIHTLDIFMSRGPRTRTQILWLLFQPSFQFSDMSQTKFPQLLMGFYRNTVCYLYNGWKMLSLQINKFLNCGNSQSLQHVV